MADYVFAGKFTDVSMAARAIEMWMHAALDNGRDLSQLVGFIDCAAQHFCLMTRKDARRKLPKLLTRRVRKQLLERDPPDKLRVYFFDSKEWSCQLLGVQMPTCNALGGSA